MGWFYMIPYTVLWVVFHGLVSRGLSNSVANPYLQMVGGGASVWSKKKGEAWAPQALPLDPALKLTVFELYFIVRNV